jgi:ATP-dependent RNA helicase DOB1
MFENRSGKKNKKNTEQTELRGVINLVIAREFGPCICFAFSKSECENYARILSKCEYTNEEEKQSVAKIFEAAIQSLSKEDQELP